MQYPFQVILKHPYTFPAEKHSVIWGILTRQYTDTKEPQRQCHDTGFGVQRNEHAILLSPYKIFTGKDITSPNGN